MKKNFLKLCCFCSVFSFAQNPLFIPDTLSGSSINLLMHPDSVQFLSGAKTMTNAFNNYPYLGPTLILNAGTSVTLNVDNQLPDTSTVHWHGLHVSAMNDGGPHTVIPPGTIWSPQFTVLDKAATYWYHPHLHMKTGEQVMKGAAGMIVVRDAEEAALNLPRTYGVDDFPLIVQSQQFDSLNQIMPRGMNDSAIFVNGMQTNYGGNVFLSVPSQIVRMRILNASQERSYRFGFTANKTFYVIGNDGGLLGAPVLTTRIQLGPGERAELLVDLSGMNGQTIYLMSYASEIQMGITGGPTMPMPPWSPPMDSPINGIDFNILQLSVGPQTGSPVTTIPPTLANLSPYVAGQANITRTVDISADSLMVMDGPFYFNGQLYDMERIDFTIPLNSIEKWRLINNTMVGHTFHIHSGEFYILDKSGLPPIAEEGGRKDVVMIPPFDSVTFIMKFEDFPDTTTPYMFHCHILMHEDDGMMGQFVISPDAVGVNELMDHKEEMEIYPNPSREIITVKVKEHLSGPYHIIISDILGNTVYTELFYKDVFQISLHSLKPGVYFISNNTGNQLLKARLIIEK